MKDFIQAPIFLSPLGCQPQYFSRGSWQQLGGIPQAKHARTLHSGDWRRLLGGGAHIKGGMAWLCIFSALLSSGWAPRGQLSILLPAGEDTETCGLAVLPPSALAACCTPMLSGAVQLLLPPLISFLFPFCAPSHAALY